MTYDRTSETPPASVPSPAHPSASPARWGRGRSTALTVAAGALLVAPLVASTADAQPGSTTPNALATPSSAATQKQSPKPRFPGHRPGRIYLGMSCGEMCHEKEPQLGQGVGIKRWYKKWGNWHGVEEAIREDRRKHRRPWILIEGPAHGSSTGWRDVGRGRYDRDIRALARVLKANDNKPIFISFDHEPSNKAPNSHGARWAHGYNRFVDVLRKANALKKVAVPPIMADWMFNKYNHEDRPGSWLLPGVLRRAPFLAVDVYQNDSGKTFGPRLSRIDRWLGNHGHRSMMLGIGESGATNYYRNTTAVKWLNKSLRWAAHHPRRVAAISYFNSTAYSREGAYWPLDESPKKLATYRKWLDRPVFINHVK